MVVYVAHRRLGLAYGAASVGSPSALANRRGATEVSVVVHQRGIWFTGRSRELVQGGRLAASPNGVQALGADPRGSGAFPIGSSRRAPQGS